MLDDGIYECEIIIHKQCYNTCIIDQQYFDKQCIKLQIIKTVTKNHRSALKVYEQEMEDKPQANLLFHSRYEIKSTIYRYAKTKYNNINIRGSLEQMDQQIQNDPVLSKYYGGIIETPKGKQIMTFYNPYCYKALQFSDVVGTDGTFKCRPEKFYQLLIVFATLKINIFFYFLFPMFLFFQTNNFFFAINITIFFF